MAEAKTYRVGLIGCGAIAQTGHVPALLAHPRFHLAACSDINPASAAQVAQQAGGIPFALHHRDLLRRDDLDAFIVAVVPHVSVPIVLDLLAARKPVLDEKPLCVDVAEGRKLVSYVEANHAIYQIGFVFRHCAMIDCVTQHAALIQKPALYEVDIFDERVDRNDRAHFDKVQLALRSGVITHEGSHVLDYFRRWNDAPFIRAASSAVRTDPEFTGPNLWSTNLDLADGSVLNMRIGWFVRQIPESLVRITGANATFRINLFGGEGEFRDDTGPRAVRAPRLEQAWSRQLDMFAQAIDEQHPVGPTARDGLRALLASQACTVAHETGTAQPIASAQ